MPDQPKTYTKEYVDQLTEQLHEARKEADWFKSRCCHWWNIFKTDEPVPMLNWIINKTPVIIWAFDKNGVFMLSEGKALASLGLKPGEVVGKSAFEIYADHPEIMDTVKQVLSGKHLTKEVNVNGCFFEVEHIPMYDSSQNLVGAVGVALEVTRRRYAEQSLKSKENLFQEIFEALPIAVVTATPDRKIERLNPAAEQLFGYRSDDIRGSLTEILYNDKKQFELIGEKHGLANDLLTTDLILRKSDGSTFFSESICTKAYDPYGKVVGLVGIHKDVTEEYRAAELHKRYERTLQTMIDNAPIRALMLDSGFNIIFANQRFADHLNIHMSKLIGAHAPEVVKDCSLREHRLANVQLVLDTGIPLTFIDQENGRWLEHYLAPLEYTNSNDKRVTIFMHDITDRIQQEELEREKIAAELHEVVSEMLESHENSQVGFQDKLKGKSLTPREMEVLKEVASGLSTKQISIKHQVSTKTVESQRLSIMRKLSIFNVADLTKHAIKQGIISLNA